MATWQVHNAKARFSELLERAAREGPQIIARRGTERAVVLSIDEYRRLVAARPNLRAYLLGGPRVDDFESNNRKTEVARSICKVPAKHRRGIGDPQAAARGMRSLEPFGRTS